MVSGYRDLPGMLGMGGSIRRQGWRLSPPSYDEGTGVSGVWMKNRVCSLEWRSQQRKKEGWRFSEGQGVVADAAW